MNFSWMKSKFNQNGKTLVFKLYSKKFSIDESLIEHELKKIMKKKTYVNLKSQKLKLC